jgi:hypothetical protein
LKYTALAGLALLAFAACNKPQTKQQKAETLVKAYLKEMMDDPSSYEAVKFDTIFKRLYNFPGEHDLDDSVELCYQYMDSTQMFSTHRNHDGASRFSDITPDAKRADYYQHKVDNLNQYIDSHGIGRTQPPGRYILAHQYRAKNMFGAR